MKPLTLGASHLCALMSREEWMLKLYMKYFICWTADEKSSNLWSSQVWKQFMQLRIKKPEKVTTSTGFEPVTSQYRFNAVTNWAMKPLTLGAGNKSYIGINCSLLKMSSMFHPQLRMCLLHFLALRYDLSHAYDVNGTYFLTILLTLL